MKTKAFPNELSFNRRILRIVAIASAVLLIQGTFTAPKAVVEKSIEYVKPGLLQMFTNWGTTFFRP
jgi:hypothetical protein